MHKTKNETPLPFYRFLFSVLSTEAQMCHFHVVASTLSLPRCRFHVVASTLSLFYRGVTFKFLTKILTASLLFYNMGPPLLSFPRCRFHVIASTLSLPRCRLHVVACTLSLPRCRFHVVAIRGLPEFQPRIHTQYF